MSEAKETAGNKPMERMGPVEHAALGWKHGAYRNGMCLSLLGPSDPATLRAFKAEAKRDGAKYLALGDNHE